MLWVFESAKFPGWFLNGRIVRNYRGDFAFSRLDKVVCVAIVSGVVFSLGRLRCLCGGFVLKNNMVEAGLSNVVWI